MIGVSMPLVIGLVPLLLLAIAVSVRPAPAPARAVRAKHRGVGPALPAETTPQ
jgi:hypothetical protein